MIYNIIYRMVWIYVCVCLYIFLLNARPLGAKSQNSEEEKYPLSRTCYWHGLLWNFGVGQLRMAIVVNVDKKMWWLLIQVSGAHHCCTGANKYINESVTTDLHQVVSLCYCYCSECLGVHVCVCVCCFALVRTELSCSCFPWQLGPVFSDA